jgi:hypothetical protein
MDGDAFEDRIARSDGEPQVRMERQRCRVSGAGDAVDGSGTTLRRVGEEAAVEVAGEPASAKVRGDSDEVDVGDRRIGLGQAPDQERDQPAIGPLREIARVGEVLEQEPGKQ